MKEREDFENTIEIPREGGEGRTASQETSEGKEGERQYLRTFFENNAGDIFGDDIPLQLEVEALAIIDEVLSGYKEDDNGLVKKSYRVQGEAALLQLLRSSLHAR